MILHITSAITTMMGFPTVRIMTGPDLKMEQDKWQVMEEGILQPGSAEGLTSATTNSAQVFVTEQGTKAEATDEAADKAQRKEGGEHPLPLF